MNRNYRSLWNESTGTFVAVSEIASSAGKKTSSGQRSTGTSERFCLQTLAACVLLSLGATAYALPAGGAVVAGAASISSNALSTTINQSTQNAAINWQSFNIAAGESVRVLQPNSSSVLLNRVLGSDPSNILGSLSANGKVFLVNPNGILFGRGASVNTAGLVASTLNVSDSDFMAGSYKFAGNSTAAVLNQGSINADGGYVALLGASVTNNGVIQARLGSVALAAGNAMTLDVAGDGLLNVSVSQGALSALAQNGGLIQADGGQVLLSAQSAGALFQSAVNNTGVIQAQTLQNHNGAIRLMGDMQSGTVHVGGTLDASAPNGGNGGFVETSAAQVKVADNAIVTAQSALGRTGTWLIDPTDFTIASSGGDITPAALAVNLATNVTISSNDGGTGTAGDINVNNAVTWGAATTLTLNAVHNVNVNAAITSNTGSLALNAGTDVIVAAGVTGITANSGNITWTAGQDIQVNTGMATGITATSGNILWTAGRDTNINSSVTATSGNFTVCCGRDINVNAAVTTTDGAVSLKAGRDLVITAAMATTRGNVVLSAGSDGSGLGVAGVGGTVVFGSGILYTVTAPGTAITLDYTPTSYATPHDYSGNFTGTASSALTQHMLVFAKGNDKVYDGNTTATLSFAGDPSPGGVVTLVPGTATFDDKNVAANIGITFSGYTLGGADATKFALWQSCLNPALTRTSAAITPRPLTIQANDATKVYGTTFTPASTAFTTPVASIAGETVVSVTEVSPAGSPVTAAVPGPYAITPSAAAANGAFLPTNYTITYVNGALTVTPAPLVITANDASKAYGQTITLPGTAFTAAGLLNGNTVGSVTEVSPGTVATAPVAGSPYAITPSAATGGTFVPTNYTISYVNGALTVTPVPLTVTANNASKPYGQTVVLATTAFSATGLVNGDTVTGVTETSPGTLATAPVAGSPYAIVPSAATGTFVPSNYTVAYVNGVLTVTPIPLTITASDATKIYGQAPVLSGFTTTPLPNGESVTSVTETSPGQPANAAPGTTYPITASNPTGSTFTPSNYTIGYVNGVLTVLPLPDVIPAGQPFEGPIVNPTGGTSVWPPVITTLVTPPQLLTLAPPLPPAPVVVVPPAAPVIVQQPTPILMPVAPPPSIYVAPHRPRKQDRN